MKKTQKTRDLRQYLSKATSLKKETGTNLDVKIIEFLISKGIDTPQKLKKFLNYSINDTPSVTEYKDGIKAVDRVVKAVQNKENVLVYGDYDVDGITATSIVINTLRALGLDGVDYYINDRFKEGFGLNVNGLEKAFTNNQYDLVITVDNGVDRIEEALYLKEKGVDLVITDHHEPLNTGELPEAIAVVNAHRLDETAEFKDMCGAGMALLLMMSVYEKITDKTVIEVINTQLFKHNISMAGFATVCDIVPLHDFNRYLVKKAIYFINETEDLHPSWGALKTNSYKKIVDEVVFGMSFGPLINSASRMLGDVSKAVELFTTNSTDEALKCANELKKTNDERKNLSSLQLDMAKAEIKVNKRSDAPSTIVYGDYHEGLSGIIAGRLKDSTNKISAVLCRSSIYPGVLKGSVRAPEGVHAKQLLDSVSDLLITYGGHSGAAGITLKEENIDAFIERVDDYITNLDCNEAPVEYIDFVMTPKRLTCDFINDLDILAPFGQGFEKPKLMIQGCVTSSKELKTKNGSSAKFNLDYDLDCIWWGKYETFDDFICEKNCCRLPTGQETVLVFGTPTINDYMGKCKPQVIVDKIEPWDTKKLGVNVKVGLSAVSYSKA